MHDIVNIAFTNGKGAIFSRAENVGDFTAEEHT
jgi:hypothetical protein